MPSPLRPLALAVFVLAATTAPAHAQVPAAREVHLRWMQALGRTASVSARHVVSEIVRADGSRVRSEFRGARPARGWTRYSGPEDADGLRGDGSA